MVNRYCLILFFAVAAWLGISMGQAAVGQNTSFLPMADSTLIDTELGDAAWGDYDNDGDFDLVLTGKLLNPRDRRPITRIFQFIEEREVAIGIEVAFYNARTSLPGLWKSTVVWGDYDNDNDLDLFIAGLKADNTPLAQVYENQGESTFILYAELTGFHSGEAAWGDYDNDGDLELLVAGVEANDQYRSVIYENQAGTFVQRDVGLVGVRDASAAWGDYDNDGDLDILLAGMDAQLNAVFKVYRNEEGGTFVETSDNLKGLPFLTVDWGDYDNDGDLDILHSGAKYSPFVLEGRTQVYRNEGGAFTLINEQLGVFTGDVAWGDYDGDGDLDILVAGERADGQAPVPVYRNDINDFNPPPEAPIGLQATVEEGVATLSWQAPPGGEGLSYNLRVGTTPGASDILSPMAMPTGRRLLSARGNAGYTLEWTLPNLPLGLYFWSVQSINAAYHGSGFAIDGLFTTGDASDRTPPAVPAGFTASSEDGQVRLSWQPNTEPDFIRYLLHRGPTPESENIFDSFPTGTEMYLDTDVQNGETYYYRLQAQDATGNLSPLTEAQAAFPKSRFTEIEVAGLPGGGRGSIAWGDYDADGDPDLAYGDRFSAAIYRNDEGEFIQARDLFPLWDFPSFDWGDYDDDGILDLAMSGKTETGSFPQFQWLVRVYRNNGSSGFGFDMAESKVRWGDYDSDGNLDLLVTARSSGGPITTLYRNDNGELIDSRISLGTSASGGVAWGDYDGDGDPDLVISDFSDDMDVYRNDGGTFTPVANVTSVFTYKTIWGDYDNDNDLDLLVADRAGSRLYRNDEGTFVDTQINFPMLTTPSTADANVDVVWGDFDNDGNLDLVFAGNNFTTIYRNTGNGFLQDGSDLAAFGQVDIEEVDFDLDGDLDLLMSGGTYGTLVPTGRVVLYRNNTISGDASGLPVRRDF